MKHLPTCRQPGALRRSYSSCASRGENNRMQRAIDLNSDMLLDPISLPLPPRRAAKSPEKTVAVHIRPPRAIEMT